MLGFSPPELLRLLQLHQQVHLRPSKACIKYMAAVLEQQLTQHWGALQQQQQRYHSGAASANASSSAAVLQLAMCVCGLSVWGVRLHLRSVAELLVLLEAHTQQLPLTVVLQVRLASCADAAREACIHLGSSCVCVSRKHFVNVTQERNAC